MKTFKDKEKSKVNVIRIGQGYFIDVEDQLTKNRLAVTREELEMIVLYGQKILEEK